MQAGSYGYAIPIQTDTDLSSSTAFTLQITHRQTGASVTRTLTASAVQAPASLGLLQYTVQSGDFPLDGLYVIQLTDTTAGRNIAMQPIELYVYPNNQ